MKLNSKKHPGRSIPRILFGYSPIQAKVFLFVALSLLMMPFLGAMKAEAASNYYVSSDAKGANNGTDWTNAYPSLPATLVRGATYYIADGSYGNYTFDDAESGSTYIYIKKAISSNHGTDTGWSYSYGDGSAIFSSWIFTTSYWEIDGQVGQWADDMPNYVAYGFEVKAPNSYSNQHLITIGSYNYLLNYINIRHTNVYFTSTTTWSTYSNGIAYIWGGGGGIGLYYSWFHRLAQNGPTFHSGGYHVIDHSVIEEPCTSQAIMNWSTQEHCISLRLSNTVSNVQISNNVFRRWRSTGGVGLYGHNTDLNIFGNIWDCDAANAGDTTGNSSFCYSSPAYPISGMGNQPDPNGDGWGYRRIYVYNNTFADLGGSYALFGKSTDYADVYMKNNIFYNIPTLNKGSVTPSYNWYYNCGTQSETGIQAGAGNPFVDVSMKDYRLKSMTNAGVSQSSPYNLDMNSVTRGADGVWDRGAYEFNSGTYQKMPSAPFNLTTN